MVSLLRTRDHEETGLTRPTKKRPSAGAPKRQWMHDFLAADLHRPSLALVTVPAQQQDSPGTHQGKQGYFPFLLGPGQVQGRCRNPATRDLPIGLNYRTQLCIKHRSRKASGTENGDFSLHQNSTVYIHPHNLAAQHQCRYIPSRTVVPPSETGRDRRWGHVRGVLNQTGGRPHDMQGMSVNTRSWSPDQSQTCPPAFPCPS